MEDLLLYPNHRSRKSKVQFVASAVKWFWSILTLHYLQWVRSEPKILWSHGGWPDLFPFWKEAHWWASPQVGFDDKTWNPLEIFPAEGPISLCPGWWTGCRGRWFHCGRSRSPSWSSSSSSSTVTWKPETPFAHDSSLGSPAPEERV